MAAANSFAKGVYTVRQAGIFLATYNQRFNNANLANNYIRIAIARNGKFDYQGGLTAIHGKALRNRRELCRWTSHDVDTLCSCLSIDRPSSMVTMQVTGAIYCEAGDTLSPAGWSSSDTDYTLSSWSSFSLARIETK